MDQKIAHLAGWGTRHEFGYDETGEKQGNITHPTPKSSCMTSEKGPVNSRFEHCDTIKVHKL